MIILLFAFWQPSIPADIVAGEDGRRADAFILGQSWFSGTVLIARDGRILLHRAYGWADGEGKVPMRTDTLFCIASISKQFTASCLLLLAEQGKLRFDAPLTAFFEDVPADKRSITLHQLLTHTAGLANNYAADGIAEQAGAIRALLQPPLARAPGERFGYTNDAYCLAALIVERVGGTAFDDFLSRQVFEPAGLHQTHHWGSVAVDDPHRVAGADRPAADLRPANYGFRGATGLFSTPADLYRWYLVLRQDRVLAPASRERLLAAAVPFSRGTVGYGWFHEVTEAGRATLWTRGSEGFGHSASLVAYLDEATLVIVASNVPESDRRAGARRLDSALEAVLFSD